MTDLAFGFVSVVALCLPTVVDLGILRSTGDLGDGFCALTVGDLPCSAELISKAGGLLSFKFPPFFPFKVAGLFLE